MKVRMVALILPALALAGCGPHSLSGTYTASDAHAAVMLQLTEGADHHLMGTLSAVQLTHEGEANRVDFSVTDGSVDARGHSIALTIKPNGLLGETRNVSGGVTSEGINLAMPDGVLHLTAGTIERFEDAGRALAAAGSDRKRQLVEKRRDQDALVRVAQLTQALSTYNARIAANTRGPDDVRKEEDGLVDAAGKELANKRRLSAAHRDYDASQAAYRVGQLAFRLNVLQLSVQQTVQGAQQHIAHLDREVKNNPCVGQATIPGCAALTGELARYQTTRARVESETKQLTQDLAERVAAMEKTNTEASR